LTSYTCSGLPRDRDQLGRWYFFIELSFCWCNGQIWYVRRPPSDRGRRRRTYSTSEPSVGDAGEPVKLSADSGVDVTEINLVDMNPDDIRVSCSLAQTD